MVSANNCVGRKISFSRSTVLKIRKSTLPYFGVIAISLYFIDRCLIDNSKPKIGINKKCIECIYILLRRSAIHKKTHDQFWSFLFLNFYLNGEVSLVHNVLNPTFLFIAKLHKHFNTVFVKCTIYVFIYIFVLYVIVLDLSKCMTYMVYFIYK